MTSQHLQEISDRELLAAVMRAARNERKATVELLGLLGEVDARRLYLGEGCASLFTYCTQVLRLSEHAAYHRIEGARIARQFPRLLELLSSGALTLTTVALLRPVLTNENAGEVIDAAVFKSKREMEVLIARLAPKPDVQTMVRRVPGADVQSLRFDVAHADTPAREDGHGTSDRAVGNPALIVRSSPSGWQPPERAYVPLYLSPRLRCRLPIWLPNSWRSWFW